LNHDSVIYLAKPISRSQDLLTKKVKKMVDELKTERVAIIGGNTVCGRMLIDSFEADPKIQEYWVIDLHSPKGRKAKKLRFLQVDLTEPGADALLAEKLTELKIQTVVHSALKNNPSSNASESHELEVIGTVNIVSAIKASQVRKLVACSTTMVYGASPKNPNYISENKPLAEHAESRFVRDKVEAERELAHLFTDAPQVVTTILRFCLIVGPRSKNYFTELLRRPAVPTLLGFDPLMQFISEEDALEALRKAIAEDFPGIFNIVGKGVIPLSYALREAGKVNLPVAPFLAYPAIQLLWNLDLLPVPGRLLDYFKYLWVADGEKAKEVMNFQSKLSSKEAFVKFAENSRVQEYKWAQ